MELRSIADFLPAFSALKGETAYVHRRGYRTLRWSYEEVARLAWRFARELDARGLHVGDRLLLWGDSCAQWVAVFLGCAIRGVIVIPIDRVAAPDFADRVLAETDAKLAVISEAINPGPGVASKTVIGLESLVSVTARHSAEPFAAAGFEPTHPLEIVFTSGTTAEPKGVVLSHQNVLSNLAPIAREIERYRRYEKPFHPLRFLNALPLSHVFGQFLGIFIPHLLGATVIFPETLAPGEMISTIRKERVSVLIAVPRVIQSLKDKIERDLESQGRLEWFRKAWAAAEGKGFIRRWWRLRRIHNVFGWKFWAFVSGGAALDASTEEFWRRMSFVVIQGYGLTETTSLISLNHPFRVGKRSIGKVLPGREIKLAPDGEILVRGAGVASGYWQGRELHSVADSEGWFKTGDLGELDAEGNLYFKGRKKDVIVTPAGLNIYPADLEAALRAQPEVRDCVVLGLNRGGNAEPYAVLLMQDHAADPGTVVQRANRQLADFQQIRRWQVWPEQDFPRTSTQKPRRQAILEAITQAEQNIAPAAVSSTLGDLVARITGRPVSLQPEAKLEDDLRLSSLDRVELISAIEDRYQVTLTDSSLTSATTVAELEKMLHSPASEPAGARVFPRWTQHALVRWIRNVVYETVSRPMTRLMARPTVVGREHLRDLKGPLLVICNHLTYLDVGFVLYALPFRLRSRLATGMLGERLWAMREGRLGGFQAENAPKGRLLRRALNRLEYFLVVALFNVFPLPQKSGIREAFEFAGESVDRGYSILVFPEGRRSAEGTLMPFRSGVGMLAKRLDVPILPIRIDGLATVRDESRRLARPGEIVVRVGKPMRFPADAPAEEIATQLENAVRSLS